jgi:predicted homoserine dehydrogenase-like protein
MFLNTKLQSRDEPIKVAFIGCGKFVSMFLAQYNQLQKIIIDTIVDINIDNAKNNCLKSGLTNETIENINFVTSLDEAIDRDVEVFIEATGNPIVGTVHAIKLTGHTKTSTLDKHYDIHDTDQIKEYAHKVADSFTWAKKYKSKI